MPGQVCSYIKIPATAPDAEDRPHKLGSGLDIQAEILDLQANDGPDSLCEHNLRSLVRTYHWPEQRQTWGVIRREVSVRCPAFEVTGPGTVVQTVT